MLQDENSGAAQNRSDQEASVGLSRTDKVFEYTEIISVGRGGSIHPPACSSPLLVGDLCSWMIMTFMCCFMTRAQQLRLLMMSNRGVNEAQSLTLHSSSLV